MIINNCLINNKLQDIEIHGGIITAVSDNCGQKGLDAKGRRVIAGLIDVHTHGCAGHDTMDGDFAPMCAFYADHGTTSVLPTTMTMSTDDLLRVTKADRNVKGANILGFHFEGPYISEKYKGAQNPDYIKNPDLEEFSHFDGVKMITLAPENEGAIDFIRAVAPDCIVSLGHTDCDFDTAAAAIEAGATSLTHTYNAMPPLNHRNPGPIGAALLDERVYPQLICDGFHISKPVMLATYKMFGADRVVMISDSLACAGLPNGKYTSGGLDVILSSDVARLTDGTVAGSRVMLWDCVKCAVEFGVPFEDAVKSATETPAKLLGVNKGKIEKGYDADLLIINDDMEIETVIIGGEIWR